jgi:hypothetical protein
MGAQTMSQRHTIRLLVLGFALGACDENPAAVRSDASEFPIVANWSSTVAPIGTSGVSGTFSVKQFAGFRMDLELSMTAPTNKTYQWRIFRGDCATTATAANAQDPNGLLLFATIQSYPDVSTGSGTTASLTREIAGSLDSAMTYSVRFRLSQSATNWNGTTPVACGNLQRAPG